MDTSTVSARLLLEDGSEFPGFSFGYEKSCAGEVVFNTGMAGYPQTLTDPSYKGQILVFTYPLIGNYGVPKAGTDEWGFPSLLESDRVQVTGLVVSEYCLEPSHFNSGKTLAEWLRKQKVPAIWGIDTRSLTERLRQHGVMRGKIIVGDQAIPFAEVEHPVSKVAIKEKAEYAGSGPRILLVDCGAKNNIVRCLLKRGASVLRLPYDYDYSNEEYDGLFLSNGPGDPKRCVDTIKHLKKALQGSKPIFGICLGNQLMALASGADTYKLKFGHRSQNQPCVEKGTQRCHITSQNHGYAIREDSLQTGWEPWFVNANDGTNEGIRHATKPFSAVQFHPEAFPGPHDTEFLFDRFLEQVRASKAAQGGKK